MDVGFEAASLVRPAEMSLRPRLTFRHADEMHTVLRETAVSSISGCMAGLSVLRVKDLYRYTPNARPDA